MSPSIRRGKQKTSSDGYRTRFSVGVDSSATQWVVRTKCLSQRRLPVLAGQLLRQPWQQRLLFPRQLRRCCSARHRQLPVAGLEGLLRQEQLQEQEQLLRQEQRLLQRQEQEGLLLRSQERRRRQDPLGQPLVPTQPNRCPSWSRFREPRFRLEPSRNLRCCRNRPSPLGQQLRHHNHNRLP